MAIQKSKEQRKQSEQRASNTENNRQESIVIRRIEERKGQNVDENSLVKYDDVVGQDVESERKEILKVEENRSVSDESDDLPKIKLNFEAFSNYSAEVGDEK